MPRKATRRPEKEFNRSQQRQRPRCPGFKCQIRDTLSAAGFPGHHCNETALKIVIGKYVIWF